MKAYQPSATAIFVANGVWWVSNHPALKVEVPALLGELNLHMVRHAVSYTHLTLPTIYSV